MNESQRAEWWRQLCRNNLWLQQFGQRYDGASFDGRTGCAFTVLQLLALGWKNRVYHHDDIARLVGYPTAPQRLTQTGLVISQVQAFIRKAGLPYIVVPATTTAREWTSHELLRRANTMGPVAFGSAYSHTPEWEGYVYRGVRADGKPNGIASPRGRAGKTQLTGFTGAHLQVILGYRLRLDRAGEVIDRIVSYKEPNHGSVPRPERPPYDDVTERQIDVLYRSFRTALGRRMYALVPTVQFNR